MDENVTPFNFYIHGEDVFIIPEEIVELEKSFLKGKLLREKVKIHKKVKKICESAFSSNNSKIKKIEFDKGSALQEIEIDAFMGCENLIEINIPSSVKKIGEGAFNGCESLEKIELPNSLTKIEDFLFTDCFKLKEVKMPSKLKHIGMRAFDSCVELESITLPSTLEEISRGAFKDCSNLKKLNIPKKIKFLSRDLFSSCTSLQQVALPKKLKEIQGKTFYQCSALKKIDLPSELEIIDNSAFQECSSLNEILLPESLTKLGESAFEKCMDLEKINIPSKVKTIEKGTFKGCIKLEKVEGLKGVTEIAEKAFEDCWRLKELSLPANITIGEKAFAGCQKLERLELDGYASSVGNNAFAFTHFKFVYKLKDSSKIIFSTNLSERMEDIEKLVVIRDTKLYIPNLDVGQFALEGGIEKLEAEKAKIKEKIENLKVYIHPSFVTKMITLRRVDDFGKKISFKYLKGEIPDMEKSINEIGEEEEILNFYKFAMAIGCFSTDKLEDKYGNKINVVRGAKASSFVASLLKGISPEKKMFTKMFKSMTFNETFSQEFLDFVSTRGEGKSLVNFEMLKRLEVEYPGITLKAARKFEEVKSRRTVINSKGLPENLSWEEALISFYAEDFYENVTNETKEIAKVFLSKGIEQDIFDEAVRLQEIAKSSGIKSNILSETIKEKTILESIEEIKKFVDETLVFDKGLLKELYEKKFTYEVLDKYDPHNYIMGVYCSCCGSISSPFYGKQIAESSVIEKDVQNLVIRDEKGEIISKGTMYIDPSGYIVINDFELNDKYRNHETGRTGYYSVKEDSEEAQERELIFKAFMRGIHAVVKQYDKEHPDCPIKKVNVGMGFNRLKKQCERFKKETNALKVPARYNFLDAEKDQRILYERNENLGKEEEISK